MDARRISDVYTKIGADLIETEDSLDALRDSAVRIIYLVSGHKKISSGQVVYGQCEKIAEKYKWGIPCDFTVTIFETNVIEAQFTDEQIRALVHHELLHIGIEKEQTLLGTDETYSIVPHDLEDFRLILEKYGVNWNRPNY